MSHRTELVDEKGEYKNFNKALKADSTSSVLGALLGNSPVTSYVEVRQVLQRVVNESYRLCGGVFPTGDFLRAFGNDDLRLCCLGSTGLCGTFIARGSAG